jgi:hypothetical protein
MIRVTVTDGGAAQEGFINEWNDCAVRALALSANVSYTKAHDLLKAEGRRDRKGTKLNQIRLSLAKLCNEQAIANYQELAVQGPGRINGYMVLASYPTLQDTIRKYNQGRYLVIATGHALTLVDGVVLDKGQISGPRSRVRNIFKITLTETKPEVANQEQINDLWARLDKLEGKL